VGHSNLR
jgi:hypothetical protein